jgi:hypothetical protein
MPAPSIPHSANRAIHRRWSVFLVRRLHVGTVLINGERVRLDLQIADGGEAVEASSRARAFRITLHRDPNPTIHFANLAESGQMTDRLWTLCHLGVT